MRPVRLVVVPVLRDRWIYCVPHHHSVSSTSAVGGDGVLARWQSKGTELLARAKDSFHQMPREGLRGRLRAGVDVLSQRIDPSESMLKCLSAAHTKALQTDCTAEVFDQQAGPGMTQDGVLIEVMYPAKLTEEQVRATLPLTVAARTQRHQHLAYGSAALLPVSLAMGLLPGPNVFLAWNAYRLYCHFHALKGGKLFLELAANKRILYLPSTELEDIVQTEERHEPLSPHQIAELSNKFNLPTLAEDIGHFLSYHKTKQK